MAKHTKEAADALVSCGLLVVEDEDLGSSCAAKKKRGPRRAVHFRKAKWTDVMNSPKASAEVKRLDLARDHFEH